MKTWAMQMCLNLFSDEPLSTRKLGQVGPVGAVYCSRELCPDQKVKQIENNKFYDGFLKGLTVYMHYGECE